MTSATDKVPTAREIHNAHRKARSAFEKARDSYDTLARLQAETEFYQRETAEIKDRLLSDGWEFRSRVAATSVNFIKLRNRGKRQQ